MLTPAAFSLRRRRPPRALISLVAMIDVLLILLVFFMVTSTYLDLDMIPALSEEGTEGPAAQAEVEATPAAPLLIRIGQDGRPVLRGQALAPEALEALLRRRLADRPDTPILLLPSGAAQAQALVTVMDLATRAGARSVRVIRLEGRP